MKSTMYDAILFKIWLEEKRGLSDSSIYVYYQTIRKFLAGNPTLDTLDSYNEFIISEAIKKRNNHYYSILKSFIEYRIDNINLRNKLMTGLIKPKERHDIIRERKHLSEDKLFEIINYLDKEKHRVIAIIQALTGRRAGDILRLKIGGIMPEILNNQNVLRMNILGKGKRRSVVYIFDEIAQEVIMNYITNNPGCGDFYFITKGTMRGREGSLDSDYRMVSMNYKWYWMDLKQALEIANVDKEMFATHDFRRCFARRVWEKFKDIHKLQKALGHSDPRVTLRYLEQSGLQEADIHYEMQK